MTVYLPDVNVVVASVRADHPHHVEALNFLEYAATGGHSFIAPTEVLASSMRILMLDVWQDPESSSSAAALLSEWLEASQDLVLGHPAAAFLVLVELARTLNLAPRRVPDALLAGSAIAQRATIVTFDRGFGSYPGLSAEILGGTVSDR